ncbi:hypothetical protein MP638_004925 [Amoeboaphelidium occidentale]|nr:hypothetical protein MP638_004925 [Amoeboaphelidium occidentale]
MSQLLSANSSVFVFGCSGVDAKRQDQNKFKFNFSVQRQKPAVDQSFVVPTYSSYGSNEYLHKIPQYQKVSVRSLYSESNKENINPLTGLASGAFKSITKSSTQAETRRPLGDITQRQNNTDNMMDRAQIFNLGRFGESFNQTNERKQPKRSRTTVLPSNRDETIKFVSHMPKSLFNLNPAPEPVATKPPVFPTQKKNTINIRKLR